MSAASNGLKIASDHVWTRNVRGFWKVCTLELLFRKEGNQTLTERLVAGLQRVSGANTCPGKCALLLGFVVDGALNLVLVFASRGTRHWGSGKLNGVSGAQGIYLCLYYCFI